MNSWHIVFVTLNSLASAIVLWTSIAAINRMSRSTMVGIRMAYIFLAVGSAAVITAPAYLGRAPTQAELMLSIGLALLSLVDRRRRSIRQAIRTHRLS